MVSVNALAEKILERAPKSVAEAGDYLLETLTGGRLQRGKFLEDPLALMGPPYFVSRYLAQVTVRALKGEYDTLDEVMAGLGALSERNPPIIERKREISDGRVVLPEAKVVDLQYPVIGENGIWQSSVEALVTSGPLRDREVRIAIRSDRNRTSCFLVPNLWIHSTIAAYNLAPIHDGADKCVFEAIPETFIVVEPLRQVNATAVARSLHCSKPQLDQIRRGKGDVTVQTLKGQLVHALFDRMLEGGITTPNDYEAAYHEALPSFLVPLASVTDRYFDEIAFRADVLRHLEALTDFYQVLDARNKLVAIQYALGRTSAYIAPRYEGFNEKICGNCPSWTRDHCKDTSDLFGDRPDSRESPELEYFRRFTRLVERERWYADQEVADLLDDSRLEFRVKNFRTIRGARIVSGEEPFTFEFEENTSDLGCGDTVLIHAGRISSSPTYHGLVREVGTKQIRVSIPLKNLAAAVFEAQSWIIDRFPSDVTAEASHTALYDFLVAPMDEKKKVVLGFPASQRRGGRAARPQAGRAAPPPPPRRGIPSPHAHPLPRDHHTPAPERDALHV